MAFKVDNQTINDLKIVGGSKGNDIYGLFNKTRTRGGAKILKDMFLYPRSRKGEIMNRVNIIRYFKNNEIVFPFQSGVFDTIEEYLGNTDERTRLAVHKDNLKRKFDNLIGSDTDYRQINKGVANTLHFFIDLKEFISNLDTKGSTAEFNKDVQAIQEYLSKPELVFLKGIDKKTRVSYARTVAYDELFRFSIRKEILKLLYHAYDIDVYIAVANVAKAHNFSFAEIDRGTSNILEMKGVYHPLVPKAVSNDITVDENHNMIFLTGANMAGKSTFMKTFGIAVYLAHMGFPVPAVKMRFSIQNGMFTTINLADNLNLGFSHFYAEVSRVKKVAESLNKNDRLIVVFDELFRGTNVKDAYDATVAVTNAFVNKRKCTFIISTHIIEAGEELRKLRNNIRFLYLPTVVNGAVPEYTYKVQEGITSDRHGMIIIRNERILETLKN